MKAIVLIVISCLIFFSNTYAQPSAGLIVPRDSRQAQVISYTIPSNGDTVSFPIIKLLDSDEDARRIEQKINCLLQEERLFGIAAPSKFDNLLRKNTISDSISLGIYFLGYEILRNDGRILSIRIDEDWQAAHPNDFSVAYSFDLTTGDLITWRSILPTKEYEQALTSIIQKRQKLIAEEIQLLKEEAKTSNGNISKDDIEYTEQQLNECLEYIEPNHLLVSDSTIITDGGSCLPRMDQAYDIDWETAISLASIKDKVNGYGTWLLHLTNKHTSNPTTPSTYYLTGTIGKYPVTVELRIEDDTTLSGSYYYNSKGNPINIYGKLLKDRSIELHEYSEDASAQSKLFTWRGELKNNTFTGTWTDAAGKKSLPIELHYR